MFNMELFEKTYVVDLTDENRADRIAFMYALDNHDIVMNSGYSIRDDIGTSKEWLFSDELFIIFDRHSTGIRFSRSRESMVSQGFYDDLISMNGFVQKMTQMAHSNTNFFPLKLLFSTFDQTFYTFIPRDEHDTAITYSFLNQLEVMGIKWQGGSTIRSRDIQNGRCSLIVDPDSSGVTHAGASEPNDYFKVSKEEFLTLIKNKIVDLKNGYNFYTYHSRDLYSDVAIKKAEPYKEDVSYTMNLSKNQFKDFIKDNLLFVGQTVYSSILDSEGVIASPVDLGKMYSLEFENKDDHIIIYFVLNGDHGVQVEGFVKNMEDDTKSVFENPKQIAIDRSIKYYSVSDDIFMTNFRYIREEDILPVIFESGIDPQPISNSDMMIENNAVNMSNYYDKLCAIFIGWCKENDIKSEDKRIILKGK